MLLHEVHALINEHGRGYRFALSGSSARKLRRLDVDLLAGRVINRQFFPLTAAELHYALDPDRVLRFELLPQVQSDPKYAIDVLEAYVSNYLREEIQQEALVRRLDSFARFLQVAALMNGQIVNVAGIAREAAVARPNVDRLLAAGLPASREGQGSHLDPPRTPRGCRIAGSLQRSALLAHAVRQRSGLHRQGMCSGEGVLRPRTSATQ